MKTAALTSGNCGYLIRQTVPMSVCVRSEHFTDICFIVDMQAAMGSRRQKEAGRKMLCQIYCLSISKLSQECFQKDEQNVLKRNNLVEYHTDLVLVINVAHRLHLQNRSLILTSAISSGKSSCSLSIFCWYRSNRFQSTQQLNIY